MKVETKGGRKSEKIKESEILFLWSNQCFSG